MKFKRPKRWRKIIRDRLPRIEQKQDADIFGVATQMNSTDAELVDALLTDGNTTSPRDLAETIGAHIDIVYRSLKRLGPLVERTYGEVQLASIYVAQEIAVSVTSSRSFTTGLPTAPHRWFGIFAG
jgi:hypothetical protein